MNEGRNTIGNRKMNRKNYEAVKKMDRQQFEAFCKSLYDQGVEAAREGGLTIDDIRKAVLSVKGIGQKRAEEIIKELEKCLSSKKKGE